MLNTRDAARQLSTQGVNITSDQIAILARNGALLGAIKDESGIWNIPQGAIDGYLKTVKRKKTLKRWLTVSSIMTVVTILTIISVTKDGLDLIYQYILPKPVVTASPQELSSILSYGTIYIAGKNRCPSDSYIFPSNVKPESDPSEALKAIPQEFDQLSQWSQLPWNLRLQMAIWNIQNAGSSWITISNKAIIEITSFKTATHVDVFGNTELPESLLTIDSYSLPCAGGGGGDDRLFIPPIFLESNQWEKKKYVSSLPDIDYLFLQPGETEHLLFYFQCIDPGIYKVKLVFDIEYAQARKQLLVEPPETIFCPPSFTYWRVSYDYTQINNTGEFILKDGIYQKAK